MSTISTTSPMPPAPPEPQRLPHIALAIGDPAGIGPEIIVSLLADPSIRDIARVTLISNQAALEAAAKATGIAVPTASDWLGIVDWPGSRGSFQPSIASAENGAFILDALRVGTRLVTQGDALCFGPLNKGAMRLGGMQEEDEIRWLAKELDYTGTCGEFNVLDVLWTARVTSHVPLSAVSGLLTRRKVANAIAMLTRALQDAGVEAPRIGVCGLNPHNGDNGNYGNEEGEIIAPGMKLAFADGYPVIQRGTP